MERIGYSVGLAGPWRVSDDQDGVVRVAYIGWWDESSGQSLYRCHEVQDDFDGRLIDGLPEARYLGRLIQGLADECGGQPWRAIGPVA